MSIKKYDNTPPLIWALVLVGGVILMYLSAWQSVPRQDALLGAVFALSGGYALYEAATHARKAHQVTDAKK